MLTKIVQQVSTKIPFGQSAVYDLWYETFTKMQFSEYEKRANEAELFAKGMSIKQREDAYWANLSKRASTEKPEFVPDYAIDNELSLFTDDYTHWNLNKFTGSDSIIHLVCLSLFFLTFSLVDSSTFPRSFFHISFRPNVR